MRHSNQPQDGRHVSKTHGRSKENEERSQWKAVEIVENILRRGAIPGSARWLQNVIAALAQLQIFAVTTAGVACNFRM
jgi:hypothetical protein